MISILYLTFTLFRAVEIFATHEAILKRYRLNRNFVRAFLFFTLLYCFNSFVEISSTPFQETKRRVLLSKHSSTF